MVLYSYCFDNCYSSKTSLQWKVSTQASILQTRNIDDRLLPYMVLVFDMILSAVWLLCWICSCGKWIQNYRNFDYANDKSAEYLLLALSILPTVISFTVHLPYIAITYLNDASHTTSMFIYYTLVVFVVECAQTEPVQRLQQERDSSKNFY